LFPKNAPSGASLALALIGLVCAPVAARAEDNLRLETDILVEQDWDSNIYNAKTDKTGSPVTIVRPGLHLANVGELGYFRMNGWLSSHSYWEESELNGIDRGVSLEVDRKLTPRFTIFGNGSLQHFADHNEIRESDSIGTSSTGQPVIQPGQLVEGASPTVNLDQGVAGVRYLLTPRSQLELTGGPFSVSYGHNDTGVFDNRDRDGWFGSLSLDYQLTVLDKLSIGLSANNTNLQDVVSGQTYVYESPFAPAPTIFDLQTGESHSEQQSVNLGWYRAWSPAWSSNLSVGVRRLHTEVTGASTPATQVVLLFGFPIPNLLPVYVASDFDDTGPGLVGEFRITRSFTRSALALGYSRETRSTSSNVTSDVNVDTFDLTFTHRLAERVTFRLTGSYQLYETANDSPALVPAAYVQVPEPALACQPGMTLRLMSSGQSILGQCEGGTGNALQSQTFGAAARIDWQLRKRLATFVVFRYYDRSGDAALLGNAFNKYNVGLGFRYLYDLDL